ncbi:PRC and DUF2382 domain-containing protein [Streptomyces sp. NPDC003077]|uniref:PRC and DUF2382 domain-containing protein n=1 Tax=Streptomyces sp. NPDC003077 TaxID=3154443 RepID=UPI0033A70EF8
MNAPLGDTPQDLTGLNVVDAEGTKVGSVQQIYRDDTTNAPEWVTVRTGLFGSKETFVPLTGARRVGDELHVPHAKKRVNDAPRIDADGHLEPSEEEQLYRHYGMTRPGTAAAGKESAQERSTGERERMAAQSEQPKAGTGMFRGRADTEAGRTKEQNPEMLVSEERLHIGTEEHETGRARLRKHVETEKVSRTVPVSHEEVRVTRERITDDERRQGRTAPRLGNGEVEVVLHEERPVVSKEAVPVERVRLQTERVTEQREVSADVRREEVDYDDGTGKFQGQRGQRGGPDEKR